ncbi:lccl domain-containing protein [Rutstroemia sp. NJR-2017a WRK4]|nr:lccl domain-containing protein [Rutstroemia sp. NJR-2017a WRK4]
MNSQGEPDGYEDSDPGSDDAERELLHSHVENLDIEENAPTTSPRFLEGTSRSCYRRVISWITGPQPPRVQKIKPLFPGFQEAPIDLIDRWCPTYKLKAVLFVVVSIAWLSGFIVLLLNNRLPEKVEGYGDVFSLGCTDTFWKRSNHCGLDGIDCRPFNDTSLAFRCPAHCASVKVLNPHAVGDQEINYRPFVIGGPIYRGDSVICGSAIHAGIINDADGGCGIVSKIGQQRDFPSTEHNGITSVEFDSYFPLSFTFEKSEGCKAKDRRWPSLVLSLIFTTLISLFTTSAPLFFASAFIMVFCQVGLVSNPPSISQLPELISIFAARLLPAAFCALVCYKFYARRSLQGMTAQYEKTVLYLGGCWFGALSNYTFSWLPIQRLTPHDIQQEPGAKLALAIVVVLIIFIAIQQIIYLRLEGRLPQYLLLYSIFAFSMFVLASLPALHLRIHHYVIAILLIPGTSMQTRPSLLYQGLLLGLFINGIARWGFDSILQTNAALREDAQFGSLLPLITEPIISLGDNTSSISFEWTYPPIQDSEDQKWGIDGISILVNDVERYRRYRDQLLPVAHLFLWEREEHEKEYFRFGYMHGGKSLDYTKAGIWDKDGTWIDFEEGASR